MNGPTRSHGRRTPQQDDGFTLIELLVVMIIIGILASIAIPVFLSQRKKAQDSAAKADVSKVGKEIGTYFVDDVTAPAVDTTTVPGRYTLTAPTVPATSTDLGEVSENNVLVVASTFLVDAENWCVTISNPKGDKAVVGYKYSAANGLVEGACGSAAG